MNHQRFDIRYIGKKGEQLEIIYKIFRLAVIPPNLKRKDRTAAMGEIFFIQLLLNGIWGNGRVIDPFYLRMPAQISNDLLCIFYMPFYPQG